MFIVRITFGVKPELAPAFGSVAKECIELASKTSGCLKYEFFQTVEDPHSYLLYEEWLAQSDFNSYKSSPTFKEIGDRLLPFLDGGFSTDYLSAEIVPKG